MHSSAHALGLPPQITAGLFDLDGVLTSTADQYHQAWKEIFDAVLAEHEGDGFHEFTDHDYTEYVDGRPRADGVRQFLASRGITVPEGSPDDPPDAATVHGIGNRKNELLLRIIERHGPRAYPGAVRYLQAAWAGCFRHIVAVDRAGQAEALRARGADVVVSDLAELLQDVR